MIRFVIINSLFAIVSCQMILNKYIFFKKICVGKYFCEYKIIYRNRNSTIHSFEKVTSIIAFHKVTGRNNYIS